MDISVSAVSLVSLIWSQDLPFVEAVSKANTEATTWAQHVTTGNWTNSTAEATTGNPNYFTPYVMTGVFLFLLLVAVAYGALTFYRKRSSRASFLKGVRQRNVGFVPRSSYDSQDGVTIGTEISFNSHVIGDNPDWSRRKESDVKQKGLVTPRPSMDQGSPKVTPRPSVDQGSSKENPRPSMDQGSSKGSKAPQPEEKEDNTKETKDHEEDTDRRGKDQEEDTKRPGKDQEEDTERPGKDQEEDTERHGKDREENTERRGSQTQEKKDTKETGDQGLNDEIHESHSVVKIDDCKETTGQDVNMEHEISVTQPSGDDVGKEDKMAGAYE